jgi:metal-dependent hydrolase (beta-lactamase superfamily II)
MDANKRELLEERREAEKRFRDAHGLSLLVNGNGRRLTVTSLWLNLLQPFPP